jgi:hypothetical protein
VSPFQSGLPPAGDVVEPLGVVAVHPEREERGVFIGERIIWQGVRSSRIVQSVGMLMKFPRIDQRQLL